MVGGIWTVIHPGAFIMERGLLHGIKERPENLAQSSYEPHKIESPPTPEVFNPLELAPVVVESNLPLTCQITDLNVYIDRAAGHCFAYPVDFTLDKQPSDHPDIIGPPRGSAVETVRASFEAKITSINPDQSLDQQVDIFLQSFKVVDPASLSRTRLTVSGEAALLVDAVPAQLSWQIIFIPHNGNLFRLMF